MAGIKQLRAWFIAVTSETRLDGTIGGVRFRNTDKPPQQTFENLTASTAFLSETSDRARVSAGATLGSEQGLTVLASNTQAKANTAQLTDRSLVVQPHQLPTVTPLANAAAEDMPTTVLETSADATNTRNNFAIRPVTGWITWLISRIFKSGGVLGDVPIKINGTNYNWGWGNVGNDLTTVNTIAANTTFIDALTTNTSFTTALQTTINNIITSTPSYFSDNLEVGFMRLHPSPTVPTKWLRCDGSFVPKATYPDLWLLLGNLYGTSNATHFYIPDFRDRQPVGYSGSKGLGGVGGLETSTLSIANLPNHVHALSGNTAIEPDHAHYQSATNGSADNNTSWVSGSSNSAGFGVTSNGTTLAGAHFHPFTGLTDGGGGSSTPFNTIDPYLAINFIIKVLL